MIDITTAVRRKLVSTAAVKALVPNDGNGNWDAFIFRWKPQVQIDGTGLRCIVISQRSSFLSPNAHNTADFPRILIEIYADTPRQGTDGPEASLTAEDRAREVFTEVDKVLHRPQGTRGVFWGALGAEPGIRINGTQRLSDADISDLENTQNVVVLRAYYGISVG